MHLPPSSLTDPAPGRCPPAPVAPAPSWHQMRMALRAVFAEVALYVCGSQRSRLHGRAALRELDARLRRDVGLTGTGPGKHPGDVEGLR